MNENVALHTGARPLPMPPMRIFVLDDSDFDRARIKRLCAQSGLLVQCLESRDIEAMKADAEFDGCDIFIVDFHLADETGADVAKMLRSDARVAEAGIIMVSGRTQSDLEDRAIQAGCDLFLSKDLLSPDVLRQALVELNVTRAARVSEQMLSDKFRASDPFLPDLPVRLEMPLVRREHTTDRSHVSVAFKSVRGLGKHSTPWHLSLADEFIFH